MKKLMIIGMAAAMLVVGCNRDEVVEQNPENAISFEGAFIDGITKAANDLTLTNLEKVSVFGVMRNAETNNYVYIFEDEEVAKGAQGKWEYQPAQYWMKGNDYWFTAIAPYGSATDIRHWNFTPNTDANVATSRGTLTFDNQAAAAEQDLILSLPESIENVAPSTVRPVQLAFQHQLSRVKFTFKNAFSSSIYKIRVNSVKINDAVASASMNLDAAHAWTGLTGNYEILFDNAKAIVAQNGSEETLHRYLIPTNKAYSVSLEIDIIQNASDIVTTIKSTTALPVIDMKKGFSYNIEATIGEGILPEGGKPIEFNVISVENWKDWIPVN